MVQVQGWALLVFLVIIPLLTKTIDSRRAMFHIGKNLYSAKLVDLPCIVESQKTLDNKQMFKVADICQVTSVLTSMVMMLILADASG